MTARATIVAALLTAASLAPLGCKSQGRAGPASPAATPDRRVLLDGDLSEWTQRVAATADEEYVYFRISIEGLDAPIQAAPQTIALWLDADASSATGARLPAPADAAGMGVDLIVEFSGRDQAGKPRGVTAYALDSTGARTPLAPSKIDLVAAPTFAAPAYELRVSRHPDHPALASLLGQRGRARVMFTMSGPDGRLEGWSDPEVFTLGAAAPQRRLSDATVPAKPPGALRVISWNVERSALAKNPSPFSRVIQVTDADIILFQEWDADPATAQAWFTATVTGTRQWHARAAAGDVVIVSPHPLTPLGPDLITLPPESLGEGGSGEPRPVRFVGALVQTPLGTIATGSLHLKCCGTAGSSEDRRRIAEAEAINQTLAAALPQGHPAMVILGGDLNLVGTRTPLDRLRMGLDLDGTELGVARPMVSGDTATYTWADDSAGFPPGRLDFITYSDSAASVAQAMVLDTARLSDKALAKMGLDRTDSAASDHLPLIVDLLPRR
jgi:endonuclease/exonuclease/phosphatase family metal-dependent hydrolase